jgi:hypothetical protein
LGDKFNSLINSALTALQYGQEVLETTTMLFFLKTDSMMDG